MREGREGGKEDGGDFLCVFCVCAGVLMHVWCGRRRKRRDEREREKRKKGHESIKNGKQ